MISVIVPVYRTEAYIEACIRSLCAQTCRDFEIILVDDGSPDRSAELAEAILRQGDVRYQIIHTENRGVSAARNTGLQAASGEWVATVDSDDVLSPDFLSNYERMLKDSPDSSILSTGFSVCKGSDGAFDTARGLKTRRLTAQEAQQAFFDREIRFLLPTLLLRRSFLKDNGILFDETVRYSEDVQFIWKCLAFNRDPVLHDPVALYRYVLHDNSTMTGSDIPKIMTAIGGLDRMLSQISNRLTPKIAKQLRPHSVFALLHGAARMLSCSDFLTLFKACGGRGAIRGQVWSGKLRFRVPAAVLAACPRLGYRILRKI
ncbi:MAG: glycosyltransferase family 2 protein [Oscillospiraceae bacterium]|nr:glycosyltransferase family 2 protein [Oscillospiraceae bacterium]